MKPLDIYRLGLRLAGSASTEAEYRSAISRLYYGLHHEACCRYFRENPFAPPLSRGSRHARLIERYQAVDHAIAREASRLLERLATMRNIADYELAGSVSFRGLRVNSRTLMGIAMVVAQELLAYLDSYSPGEAPDGCDCPTVYSSR